MQFGQYPEGLLLSSYLATTEDDESANSFSLKFVRPLGPHFDVDFKYTVYFNRLPRNDLNYLRMIGSFGIGWHW